MRCAPLILALLFAMISSAAEPPKKIFPLAYDRHDYPNGLRLITIPTDYPNVVAVYIVVQTGSRNEVEPGRSGFAHLFEHMMFRGTPLFPPEKYQNTLKQIGAASNAFTSDDLTAYHTTFSKEDLDTVMRMEADRFAHLEYSTAVFKTETLAVLGEYNKNSAAPTSKLFEVLRDTAYDQHTYKHTTMGFLRDIQNMPNLYDYSRLFFQRYYRPEYTTIIIAGDVTKAVTVPMVEKYWGSWQRGDYKADVPVEPQQTAARTGHVDWPTPTLPWVTVAFKAPAFTETDKDGAALNLIGALGFSEISELYQRLVIREQKVDALFASNPSHVDPYLFTVTARVKNGKDLDSVRDDILSTLATYREAKVPAERLESVKQRLRYSFALSLDNSEAIAGTVARFVALTRDPESINRAYATYDALTPEDLQAAARKYLVESGRTIVTLTGKAQ